MKVKIFASLFVSLLLYVQVSIADNKVRRQDLLAWEKIAEIFCTEADFCMAECPAQTKSKDIPECRNFVLDSNNSIIAWPSNTKISEEGERAELLLAKWQESKWTDLPAVSVKFESNSIILGSNAITEGIYRLLLRRAQNNTGGDYNLYAIIADNWKKDLLAFCRHCKEQIETNPDPQLIYSSIVVSHFDHLMGLVSESSILSENILNALAKAVDSQKTFEEGKCPDLVKGLNKLRLKRFEGDVIEEFVVFVPDNYDDSRPEAVFLQPDSHRRAGPENYPYHSGMINVWWHTVGDKNINWKSYQFFFKILKRKLNVDENRIYVHGRCGNALSVMSMALKFPDEWAQCSMSMGNTYRYLAGNALNLPLIFVKGGHGWDYLLGYYDFAVECFKYNGCRFFKHSKEQSIEQVRGDSVPNEVRNLSPHRVFYTIESLANPKAYWVRIDGREDENFLASIDASARGQSIFIKTKNVDAYTLNLELAPVDHNKATEIVENGDSLGFVTSPVFTNKSEKYSDAIYVKDKSLHGPVADVFTDQYAVVWTGGEREKKLAEQLAGSGPCFSDVNFPYNFIDTHNVVFVGRLQQSKHFAEIADKLPIIIEKGKLTTDGAVTEGNMGAIFIHPNPLNAEKYITVFSGTSDKASELLSTAWEQVKSDIKADAGIFEVVGKNKFEWLRCEKFDTVWSWHKSWDFPLARLTNGHDRWQWCQWVAKVIRKQLEVDMVICEAPFRYEGSIPVGQVTCRDIFNNFRNDWIIKIKLDGKSVRELLMISFNNTSEREVDVPVIEGVSFVKMQQGSEGTALGINEIKNDRDYTVALPEKCINGKRLGLRLKDYKIVGEGHLVPIVKDYLSKSKNLDIDAQLDSLKLKIL